LPTHYAFKVGQSLDRIEQDYRRLNSTGPEQGKPQPPGKPSKASRRLIARVEEVIAAADDTGRWVEDGTLRYHGDDDPTRRVIDCRTFIANVGILGNFLATAPDE
jgi:hypothetical protein